MTHSYYNTTENLTGIMLEFGKYTLKYEPPSETPEDHSVSMTISSEANLQQMLEFFQSFLRAAGYEFDGKELCLERSAPDFGDYSGWGNSGASYWGGYPQGGIAYKGGDGEASTQNYPIMN
jgi:hypothetical protein